MLRPVTFAAVCAAGLAACTGGTPSPKDGGTDAGPDPLEPPVVAFSGTARVLPEAATWLQDAGQPVPSLTGVTLRVEEPLLMGLNDKDPRALFGEVPLDPSGAFSVSTVDTADVIAGVAAGFRDEVDAGIARGASTLWDKIREGSIPLQDVSGTQAWAFPTAFVDHLTTVVGGPAILSASDNLGDTLQQTGFALIRVVDAAGAPVTGARLGFSCGIGCVRTTEAQFLYPSADFASVTGHGAGGKTAAHGLVLYVHNNNQAHQVAVTVEGNGAYKTHAAGAAPNAGLFVTVSP
jgi:hypothetical protein